jgi:hypothetical protein
MYNLYLYRTSLRQGKSCVTCGEGTGAYLLSAVPRFFRGFGWIILHLCDTAQTSCCTRPANSLSAPPIGPADVPIQLGINVTKFQKEATPLKKKNLNKGKQKQTRTGRGNALQDFHKQRVWDEARRKLWRAWLMTIRHDAQYFKLLPVYTADC